MEKTIDDILDRLKNIQTFSSVIQRINTLLADDSASINAVAGEIEKDVSIVATILRLANSSYYGLPMKITTIPMAVMMLGINTVRNLLTTVSLCQLFRKQKDSPFDTRHLWWHSLGCAISSKMLLWKSGPDIKETAFICGLIHDIGKVVIAQVLPQEMSDIYLQKKQEPLEQETDIEREILGFTHAQIGAGLARRWQFPDAYCEVIKNHHAPAILARQALSIQQADKTSTPGIPAKSKEHAYALLGPSVFIGNQLVKALGIGISTVEKAETIDDEMWELLGIPLSELPMFLGGIKDDFSKLKASWSLA